MCDLVYTILFQYKNLQQSAIPLHSIGSLILMDLLKEICHVRALVSALITMEDHIN